MDRLRSLLTLSVSRQALLTGAVSAMMLGGTAAALVIRVADLPTRDPEKSATGRQLKIAVDNVPPPAATRQPRMATLAPAPRPLPFNPAETALAAPRQQAVAVTAPAPAPEGAVAPPPVRPQQRLGGPDRFAAAPSWAPPAPPPSQGPAVRAGRPTDALAQARRAWAAQAPPEDDRIYADEERAVDPRDDGPPPGWRGRPVYPQQAYPRQAYRRPAYPQQAYRQPADPRGYAADPYADRYPDPYADYDPYLRRR